jgi:hypothetical protein
MVFESCAFEQSGCTRAPFRNVATSVQGPDLHHSTPFTSLSRSGTDFQPRHLALIFRESPVDDYVSNSQVDASRFSLKPDILHLRVMLSPWPCLRKPDRHGSADGYRLGVRSMGCMVHWKIFGNNSPSHRRWRNTDCRLPDDGAITRTTRNHCHPFYLWFA